MRSVASICLLACLAVDFCGGVLGEAPDASVAVSQKIPGLKLSEIDLRGLITPEIKTLGGHF